MPNDPPHRRKYVGGQLQQITPEWREAVVARLAELGRSRTWLAGQVGADKSAITVLLRPSTTVSRLVGPVSHALSVAPPLIGADLDQSDIVELVGRLDDNDRALAIDFLRRLSEK